MTETPADKLREYELHKANGDTDLAMKAWREYWDSVGREMAQKEKNAKAA